MFDINASYERRLIMQPLPILAMGDNTLFYLIPLAIGISFVYSASRYELPARILSRAVRLCFTIVGFMALVLVVLMTLQLNF